MQFARKPRRRPFINIIPLIDVLVVLLIFYIATTVFKKSQPKLNIVVPSSTTATTTQDALPSILYVTAEGKMFLDDVQVEPDNLGALWKSKKDADPNYKVAMKADGQMTFATLTKVYDAANFAGIFDLQAFTAPKADGAPAP